MVHSIESERYSFVDWEKTDEGWWRSTSAIMIGGQQFPTVTLTLKELDSSRINDVSEQLKVSFNELLEMHDAALDLVTGAMDSATAAWIDYDIVYQ